MTAATPTTAACHAPITGHIVVHAVPPKRDHTYTAWHSIVVIVFVTMVTIMVVIAFCRGGGCCTVVTWWFMSPILVGGGTFTAIIIVHEVFVQVVYCRTCLVYKSHSSPNRDGSK